MKGTQFTQALKLWNPLRAFLNVYVCGNSCNANLFERKLLAFTFDRMKTWNLFCCTMCRYIDRFHDAFVEEKLLAVNTFHIRNEKYQSCLTNVESSQRVELQPCDPNRRNQQWFFRYNQTGIQNLASDLCLDGVLGEVPTTLAADTTMIAEYFSAGKSFPFIAYPCSSESPSQVHHRATNTSCSNSTFTCIIPRHSVSPATT